MKKGRQFLLIFSVITLCLASCKRDKYATTEEMKETAAEEQDSMFAEIETPIMDTAVAEVLSKEPELAKIQEKNKERVKVEVENSEYKDIPCNKIIEEYKLAVDEYCAHKITIEQLKEKKPDSKDTKVRLCIQKSGLDKVYDEINEKLDGCLSEE